MDQKSTSVRAGERLIASEPLRATFGFFEVVVFNVGALGAQIEHAHPLRIGTAGRLIISRDGVEAAVNGRIVWSQLSKTPDQEGRHLYRSGVRIEEQPTEFLLALHSLARGGIIRRDPHALERKRQYFESRQRQRESGPVKPITLPQESIPLDQARMVRQARARLRTHPEEAQKWYNRARYAITDTDSAAAASVFRDRDEVLAVWECLHRSVPIPVIVRVFELG